MMNPFARVEAIGGAQSLAHVASHIDTLEISTPNGKGPGTASSPASAPTGEIVCAVTAPALGATP